MAHGVVADEMPGCGDGADDVRTLTDEVADEEESGMDVVRGEKVEEPFGDDIVGAVVVGQCDLIWIAGSDEDFAEDLGLGGESGVSAAASEESCSGESCGRRRNGGSVHRRNRVSLLRVRRRRWALL